MTKHSEHCESCFAFKYCPDKGTENECKAEEKNDKIFQFNCGRGSGKQTKMLEAVIRWAESNKGCGAFAMITADEANRLSGLEKENKKMKQEIKIIGELLGTEAYVSNISYKIGCLKGLNMRFQETLEQILKKAYFLNSLPFEKHKKIDLYTELRLAVFAAKQALGVKDV